MNESTNSKIDDKWVKLFIKNLATLTKTPEKDLVDGVKAFEQEAVKVGEENLKKGPVTQYKIEAAGGGKLVMAAVNAPLRVKVSALNVHGIAVADFTGKVKISANKTLVTDPLETADFVAGVLDNIEIKFKLPNTQAKLTVEGGGVTTESAPLVVLGAPGVSGGPNGKLVASKTEKARAVLAQPPTNPGSAALAELRKMRPAFGLNNAPRASTIASQIGNGGIDDKENCGAVTLGAICGKNSTQLVDQLLRTRLEPAIRLKVTQEFPLLSGPELENKIKERLDSTANNFNCIQNQSVYWRSENLDNLRHNFYPEDGVIPPGMPDNPKGEACGESQLAATRELLVAEAKRRNDGGGIGGVKYKVIQDGMNDTDPVLGKFYDLKTKELQKQMAKYPDGTQFQVFLTGPGFSGHWVYGEKYNGNVVIEDYQKSAEIGKKGATAYTGDDEPHSPTTDAPDVFEKGMFIALCPDTADEKAIGAWAENPKWPQGGVPSRVVDQPKDTGPVITPAPESEVLDALNTSKLDKITDPSFRKGLLDFLDKPDAVDESMAKKLLAGFRLAPEGDNELREKIFKKAFACKFTASMNGKRAPVPGPVLNKMVDILETLPRDHLPANWDLAGATGSTKTSGSWDPDNKKATFEYGADDAPAFDQAYDNAQPGDPLEGTKCFDVMVRHEVGHAVHSDKGGDAVTDAAMGGSWRKHGAFTNVLAEWSDLVSDFASRLQSVLNLPAKPDPAVIRKYVGEAGQDNLKVADKLKKALSIALVNLPGIPFPSTAVNTGQKQDHVASLLPMDHDLIKVTIQGARTMPYFELGASPTAVGGRVYLNAENADGWVSFDAASFANRVSMYQYRSPSEWFAEFYAGVNNGSASVRKKAASKYPAAHGWMKSKQLLLYPDE